MFFSQKLKCTCLYSKDWSIKSSLNKQNDNKNLGLLQFHPLRRYCRGNFQPVVYVWSTASRQHIMSNVKEAMDDFQYTFAILCKILFSKRLTRFYNCDPFRCSAVSGRFHEWHLSSVRWQMLFLSGMSSNYLNAQCSIKSFKKNVCGAKEH